MLEMLKDIIQVYSVILFSRTLFCRERDNILYIIFLLLLFLLLLLVVTVYEVPCMHCPRQVVHLITLNLYLVQGTLHFTNEEN